MKDKNSPTLLLILDGFGLSDKKNKGNAITPKTAPNIFGYMKKYPSSTLKASGKSVGLFPQQAGNSEAGHLNIGAGRVVKQDLVRISESIKDGTFFKNEAFLHGLRFAKKKKSSVHVMGLLTNEHSGHARLEHLIALLDFFRQQKVKHVYLHLFTDGRDSPPHSAVEFLTRLRRYLKNGETIATVMGRYYAMDRNKVWSRTEKAYNAMVLGKGTCKAESAEEAIAQAYNRNETDDFICPTVIMKNKKPVAKIESDDVIFFFNARSDRARQITKTFVQPQFQKMNPGSFKRTKKLAHTHFVAMSEFGPDLPGILTAFPSGMIENTLAKAIGESYQQLYLTETEKYAHLTYFINGGHANAVNGEERRMVRTKRKKHFEKHPEMNAKKLTSIVLKEIKTGASNFICVNYPNADMVAHTGDFEATKKAVSILDKEIKRLVEATLKKNGQVLIVSDHGNAEEMIDLKTGGVVTGHSTNPVPCVLIRRPYKGMKMKDGKLADVAPTVLKMLELNKPKEMTGKALF
jgi:2,3-bisphosphoglycerate-independent phosphoglycerate mutase